MKKCVFIFLLCLCPLSYAEDLIRPAIVGGTDAPQGEYPWAVALIRSDYETISDDQFCGGSLIHPNWVLTAAHCVDDKNPDDLYVAVGEVDLNQNPRLIAVSMVLLHPGYNLRTGRGTDLALLRLAEPVTDIPALPINRSAAALQNATEGKIMGWGSIAIERDELIRPSTLQVADVPILEEYRSIPERPGYFGVGNEDPTRSNRSGDSGSPFIIRDPATDTWVAAGFSSYGTGNPGEIRFTSILVDIQKLHQWIDAQVFNPFVSEPSRDVAMDMGPRMIRETGSEPKLALRVWPFSDKYSYQVFQGYALYNQQRAFDIQAPDTYRYRGDGSFDLYLPLPQHSAPPYSYGQTNLNRVTLNESPRLSNAFFKFHPFFSINAFIQQSSSSLRQEFVLLSLADFQAGIPFKFYIDRSELEISIHQVSTSELEIVAQKPAGAAEFEFTPEAGKSYWLSVKKQPWYSPSFTLYAAPVKRISFSSDEKKAATLSEDSHTYRRDGYKVETLTYDTRHYGEVELQVYSAFDCEISLNHQLSGKMLAYYDQESEDTIETFIVSGSDLFQNEIRIFNFDTGIYGAFTVQATPHVDRPLAFDVTQQRALTDSDDYTNISRPQTSEALDLPDLSNYESFKIKVYGKSTYNPRFAIFGRNAGLIESAAESVIAELEIEIDPSETYRLIVADFHEPRNSNYEVTLTGTLREDDDFDGFPDDNYDLSIPPPPNPDQSYSKENATRHHDSNASPTPQEIEDAFQGLAPTVFD